MTQILKRQNMLKLFNMDNMKIKKKVQVVVIALDEILLFEFNNTIPNNYVGFQNITGAVDEGEEYDVAAKRELFEEAGIDADVCELELKYEFVDRWKKYCQERIYVCYLNEKPVVKLCPEHLNFKWVPYKSLTLSDYTFPSNFSAAKAAIRFLEDKK